MAENTQLAKYLELPQTADGEEITSGLVALLTSAVHDTDPKKSVSDVHKIIVNEGGTSYLDPLNMLPLLIPCDDPAAKDLIAVIGECGPAKEVVMAVQEVAERLEHILEAESEDDEEEEESELDPEETSKPTKPTPPLEQFTILIDLYASAIPRMKLRRKSASETLEPLLNELETLLKIAGPQCSRDIARTIVSSVAQLGQRVQTWFASIVETSPEELKACTTIAKALLDQVLLSCAPAIQGQIAQRTLHECFPRFALRSSNMGTEWQGGHACMSNLLAAYKALQVDLYDPVGQPSASHLVATAYQPLDSTAPDTLLQFLLPPIISSIQSNTFLDESLAVLLRSLNTWQSTPPKGYLPPEITIPLSDVVPSIASIHPDPQVRHQAFRVLSLLLSCSEPKMRFQQLIELTAHSEFPQMRVASVGLVKEAMLQAFAALSTGHKESDELFLAPLFLRTFGPILFRPDPPDLFAGSGLLEMKTFQESSEPARLTECLSLYYVLLQRDGKNLTGIRDKDVLKTVDSNLLAPLRKNLTRWMSDPAVSNAHLHDITSIASLHMSLERVDVAKAGLGFS